MEIFLSRRVDFSFSAHCQCSEAFIFSAGRQLIYYMIFPPFSCTCQHHQNLNINQVDLLSKNLLHQCYDLFCTKREFSVGSRVGLKENKSKYFQPHVLGV